MVTCSKPMFFLTHDMFFRSCDTGASMPSYMCGYVRACMPACRFLTSQPTDRPTNQPAKQPAKQPTVYVQRTNRHTCTGTATCTCTTQDWSFVCRGSHRCRSHSSRMVAMWRTLPLWTCARTNCRCCTSSLRNALGTFSSATSGCSLRETPPPLRLRSPSEAM